ncbi:hypothetical protein L873DRAFT_1686791, partial [Choiromyces venosus 120613-1]
ANRLLSESEELAVCLYLRRLDSIGISIRVLMVIGYANTILSQGLPEHEPG